MEFRAMRHFTKEEQKKYTESISKLYKPTGGNIMADKINDKSKSKRNSYEERIKEMAEEKVRKEAKLEDGNLIKEEQMTRAEILEKTIDFDDAIQRIVSLEKENAELKKVAEFQQSSNMSRHFENKKLKEVLAVGSTFNKALNSMNKSLEEERDKYRNMVFDKDEQLTKAKEIIKELLNLPFASDEEVFANVSEILGRAEQFLKEE